MNLNEFKAWMEGFSEAIDGAPTEKQWSTIKEKLEQTEAITVAVGVPYDTSFPTVLRQPAPYIPYSGTGDMPFPVGTVTCGQTEFDPTIRAVN